MASGTNDIARRYGTAITFADSAQTPDETLTLSALASGAIRISDQHDRGDVFESEYEWRISVSIDPATTLTTGETVDLYVATGDGTNEDGEEGTADGAVSSANKLDNMRYVGSAVVDSSAGVATRITASGTVSLPARYFSAVVHNNTSDPFETSTANHTITFTPTPAHNNR